MDFGGIGRRRCSDRFRPAQAARGSRLGNCGGGRGRRRRASAAAAAPPAAARGVVAFHDHASARPGLSRRPRPLSGRAARSSLDPGRGRTDIDRNPFSRQSRDPSACRVPKAPAAPSGRSTAARSRSSWKASSSEWVWTADPRRRSARAEAASSGPGAATARSSSRRSSARRSSPSPPREARPVRSRRSMRLGARSRTSIPGFFRTDGTSCSSRGTSIRRRPPPCSLRSTRRRCVRSSTPIPTPSWRRSGLPAVRAGQRPLRLEVRSAETAALRPARARARGRPVRNRGQPPGGLGGRRPPRLSPVVRAAPARLGGSQGARARHARRSRGLRRRSPVSRRPESRRDAARSGARPERGCLGAGRLAGDGDPDHRRAHRRVRPGVVSGRRAAGLCLRSPWLLRPLRASGERGTGEDPWSPRRWTRSFRRSLPTATCCSTAAAEGGNWARILSPISGGGDPVRLTENPRFSEEHPAISPDGRL